MCLYGNPDGTWEVSLPAEEVPPELPEPALGINFARDGMHRRDWLSLVAVHSDSWLLSVAFFFAAPLSANERYFAAAPPPSTDYRVRFHLVRSVPLSIKKIIDYFRWFSF